MQTHPHLVLWAAFLLGAVAYIVKRSFYMITGPMRVASSVSGFLKVAAIPLAFRLLVDSGIYWALFTPQISEAILKYLGWQSAAGEIDVVTQHGAFAFFFGLGIDPLVDWGIGSLFSKVPVLKDIWPQMPGPMSPTTTNLTKSVTVPNPAPTPVNSGTGD